MTALGARLRGRGGAPPGLTVAAVLVAAAASLPLVYLVVRAASGGASAWSVLARPQTAEVLARTVVLVGVVTVAATGVGGALAWLVERTDLPLRRLWAVAAALPLAVPSYVAALALLATAGPGGVLEAALPEITGFAGAALALTLSTYPYVYLLCAAALRRADPALEEAARGLGRSPSAVLREVTLPLARPALGAGALLAALYALSDFGVVSLMRLDVLTRVIFQQYRTLFDRTPAAVLGLLLVTLTVIVLLLEARARGRAAPRAAPTAARPAPPVPLGRWRPAALGFCAVVVGLALVLPLAVLALWLLRGGAGGGTLDTTIVAPALGSVAVSLLAGAVAVAAALPVALLVTRTPRRWTRALERLSYGANALPGVVVALALVFFAARYLGALYQTLALLLFAYVVRFLPQALSGARTALAAVNPRLEEAARALGRGPRSAFAAVTVPLAAPGLLAGATIVFLSTMKELPVTLLLRPIGFETLATEVWSATSVSAYSRAAPAALVLVAVSAPIVLGMVARHDGARAEAEGLGAG